MQVWMSVKQVSQRLGVAVTTVYQLCQEQRIAHIRIGIGRGAIRISEDALQTYVTAVTVQADHVAEPPPAAVERLKHIRV